MGASRKPDDKKPNDGKKPNEGKKPDNTNLAAQRQDLRDLRAATDARHALTPGTPEHDAALEHEQDLLDRVWAWATAGWSAAPSTAAPSRPAMDPAAADRNAVVSPIDGGDSAPEPGRRSSSIDRTTPPH